MAESLRARSRAGSRWAGLRTLWHPLRELRARHALRAARWAADAELLRRDTAPLRLAWRAAELVDPTNRLELAHTLRSLVREANPRYLPTASPVNRVAVRAESEMLLALAARLADLERSVAPRGVLLVQRLLVDGAGPLYERESVDDLPVYLDVALGALEPR
jgi:hypothetical protein